MLKDGVELRDHQHDGIVYMAKSKKGLLALPAGSGKTLLALVYFAKLKEKGIVDKTIIITEKSLTGQIQETIDDFFSINMNLINVANQTKKKRLLSYNDAEVDIIVLNYQKIKNDFDELLNIIQNNDVLLILDEATAIKNPKSIVSQKTFVLANEYFSI